MPELAPLPVVLGTSLPLVLGASLPLVLGTSLPLVLGTGLPLVLRTSLACCAKALWLNMYGWAVCGGVDLSPNGLTAARQPVAGSPSDSAKNSQNTDTCVCSAEAAQQWQPWDFSTLVYIHMSASSCLHMSTHKSICMPTHLSTLMSLHMAHNPGLQHLR